MRGEPEAKADPTREGEDPENINLSFSSLGVLGASGYTGSELVRLLLRHPRAELVLLTADRRAGQEMRAVFPQFSPFKLPTLVSIESVDWKKAALDVAFCALPHATTQVVIKDLFAKAPGTKVVDLSADFRLADPAAYAKWYGHEHHAPELQRGAVYGLVEMYRSEIAKSRLVANPGCYTSTSILALAPLLCAKLVEPTNIIIDAKSGVSGAGRTPKLNTLYSECNEAMSAYSVGDRHRHLPEPVRLVYRRASGVNNETPPTL